MFIMEREGSILTWSAVYPKDLIVSYVCPEKLKTELGTWNEMLMKILLSLC